MIAAIETQKSTLSKAFFPRFPGVMAGDVVVAPHCLTWPAGTCPEGAFAVEDPWTSPSMRAAWDWNLGLRRPDGQRAPIDDSVAIGHPSALLAEIDPADSADRVGPFLRRLGRDVEERLAGLQPVAEFVLEPGKQDTLFDIEFAPALQFIEERDGLPPALRLLAIHENRKLDPNVLRGQFSFGIDVLPENAESLLELTI
jgi:hypothetical protein